MSHPRVSEVFVGRPSVLGEHGGRPVHSGIVKHRVRAGELDLALENLAGDQQADLRVHGGPDKAVYVYPAEHYAGWRADGFGFETGMVGENISTTGASEDEVRVGDRWAWGTAVVQICQPRMPCYKLGMRVGRTDAIPRMLTSGRCGWYLRVLTPGRVPTSGPLTVLDRDPGAPTITELHEAMHLRGAPARSSAHLALLRRALAHPDLAESWKAGLAHRLERL